MTANETMQNFIARLEEWRWPEALRALEADVMLVTDANIAAALVAAYGPFKCMVASPETFSASLTPAIHKLVFLCRENERAQVRGARSKYPALQVFSTTYDLAPVSVGGGGFFEWQVADTDPEAHEPLIILATPGSDAEYFNTLLEKNGLGSPREYINRTVACWAGHQSRFEPLRFLRGVNRKYGRKRLQIILYTDVLLSLVENGHLTLKVFASLLKKSRAKVIYFSRRDKSMQATLLSAIGQAKSRSLWPAYAHTPAPTAKHTETDTLGQDGWINTLLYAESLIEPMLTSLDKFKFITLEETVESPQEVLESVAVYLNKALATDIIGTDYFGPYKTAGNIFEAANIYRKILIDRLGLKVNEHGSYVADTDVSEK